MAERLSIKWEGEGGGLGGKQSSQASWGLGKEPGSVACQELRLALWAISFWGYVVSSLSFFLLFFQHVCLLFRERVREKARTREGRKERETEYPADSACQHLMWGLNSQTTVRST